MNLHVQVTDLEVLTTGLYYEKFFLDQPIDLTELKAKTEELTTIVKDSKTTDREDLLERLQQVSFFYNHILK